MTKRGEPLPINQAMNRSRTKAGLELTTWMVIVFVSIAVFLVGFRNKISVLLSWFYSYINYKRGARVVASGIVPPPHAAPSKEIAK